MLRASRSRTFCVIAMTELAEKVRSATEMTDLRRISAAKAASTVSRLRGAPSLANIGSKKLFSTLWDEPALAVPSARNGMSIARPRRSTKLRTNSPATIAMRLGTVTREKIL